LTGIQNKNIDLNDSFVQTEEQFDISVYLRILRRNKWIIIITPILCLLAGSYVAKNTAPVYSATAKILADPYQPNADREEQYIASAMVFLFFETQYEIIRSRIIAETVVDKLGLVAKAREEQKKNEPKSGIIKDIKDSIKNVIGYKNQTQTALTDRDLRTILANLISANIKVTGGRKNQIITISYESKDPQQAAEIINALSEAYIEFGMTTRLNDVKNRQRWLSSQYQQLQLNLEKSEQRVKEYSESQGLIGSLQQQAMANTQLQSLNTNLVQAQTELSVKSEEYALVQQIKKGSKDFSSLAQVMQNSTIGTLGQNASTAENKVQELADRYGEKHPKMMAARTELRSTTRNLELEVAKVIEQIENDYKLSKIQVDNINQLINNTKTDVQELQDESFSLISLEREVENNRRIYESFQSRLLEANVRGENTASNVHIIDNATVPREPISPNVKKIIGLAGIAGLFLGVILAFARELSNNTFRTPDLLEDKIKVPVLGITQLVKKNKLSVTPEKQYLDNSRTPFAESINTIRTGLIFSNIDKPPQTILITSSTGAEGKSTLALNLAVAFSNIGKTLLLEVDLRKPSVAKNLQIKNTKGLTDILSNSVKKMDEVIVTQNDGRLNILCCGTIPQDPMELLSSKKFEKLLATLQAHYEYIVLDGPPTLPVSDSSILGNKVDGVIVAIRAEVTKIKVAKEAVSRLKKLNANVIGTVLTLAEPAQMSHYDDHYYAGEYYGTQKNTKSS
jgi:succinoglycan biosynthesis transport protein ExoP